MPENDDENQEDIIDEEEEILDLEEDTIPRIVDGLTDGIQTVIRTPPAEILQNLQNRAGHYQEDATRLVSTVGRSIGTFLKEGFIEYAHGGLEFMTGLLTSFLPAGIAEPVRNFVSGCAEFLKPNNLREAIENKNFKPMINDLAKGAIEGVKNVVSGFVGRENVENFVNLASNIINTVRGAIGFVQDMKQGRNMPSPVQLSGALGELGNVVANQVGASLQNASQEINNSVGLDKSQEHGV